MRVVLDTNVLVSALLDRRGTPGSLLLLWTYDYFELLVSDHILDELIRTLTKPYFRPRLTTESLEATLALLRREGRLTPLSKQVRGVATHPEDDLILATAVSGGAKYLVTGDAKLMRLGTYRDVRICSPREFLVVLRYEPE